MTEYIERRFAVDAIADTMAKGFVEDRFILPQELQDLQDELEMLPAADVASVVHGRWIYNGGNKYVDHYHCDRCGQEIYLCNKIYTEPKPNYCKNCGAKMDFPEKESAQGGIT